MGAFHPQGAGGGLSFLSPPSAPPMPNQDRHLPATNKEALVAKHDPGSANAFWDDPDIKNTTSWVKFEDVGDTVSGTIAKLGKKTWQDGSVAIEITFVEPDVPVLTASQVLLKTTLGELQPGPGDKLSVSLAAIEKLNGGKTLKRFVVEVTYAIDGNTVTVDQTA